MGPVVVRITVPDVKAARKLAKPLVEEGLAACVSIVPGVRSIYRWEGKTCDEQELLLVVKTRRSCFEALERRVRELHPYSVPEVIALPIVEGSAPYLDWLAATTRRCERPAHKRLRQKRLRHLS